MKKLISLAVIAGLARWLADAQRRSAVVDRLSGVRGGVASGVASGVDTVRSTAADARDTVVGRATEIIPGVGRAGDASEDPASYAGNPDDARLHDRVQSELFRDDDVPKGDININVEFGKVVLRGQVESRELIDDLVTRVRAVEGVSDVESLLHVPGEPAPMHE